MSIVEKCVDKFIKNISSLRKNDNIDNNDYFDNINDNDNDDEMFKVENYIEISKIFGLIDNIKYVVSDLIMQKIITKFIYMYTYLN